MNSIATIDALQVWSLLAELHARMGDMHIAKGRARVATRIPGEHADSAEGHFLLANALMAENVYGAAKQSYYKAIRLDPGHVNSMVNLGVVLGANNDYEEAIPIYRRAVELQVTLPSLAVVPNSFVGAVSCFGWASAVSFSQGLYRSRWAANTYGLATPLGHGKGV